LVGPRRDGVLARIWWVASPAAFVFHARIIYEKTHLKYGNGSSGAEFSLAHLSPAFFLFGLAATLVAFWWLGRFIWTLYRQPDGVGWREWVMLALLAGVVTLSLLLPG